MKEPSLESVIRIANGFLASQIDDAARDCQRGLEAVGRFRVGHVVTNADYARILGAYIKTVGEALISSYQRALKELEITHPSPQLFAGVSKVIRNAMDKYVEGHRTQVKAMADRNEEEWPWNTTESAIHVANSYVDGQLEIMANAPKKEKEFERPPIIAPAPPPVNPPSLWSQNKGNFVGIILTAVLTGVITAAGFLIRDARNEKHNRRFTDQRELVKELSPEIKACKKASLDLWALGAVKDTTTYWTHTPDSLSEPADAEKACDFAVKKDPELAARLLTAYSPSFADLFKRFGTAQDDFVIESREFLSPLVSPRSKERNKFDSLYTKFDDLSDTLQTKLITEMGK